jgi:pimeloyl-ACP methyl ester carboxylesterase
MKLHPRGGVFLTAFSWLKIVKVICVFASLLTFSINAIALEEPPGSLSLEESIQEEQRLEAHRRELYQSSYSQYTVKPHEAAIILFHGKWGAPPAPQASAFTNEGFHVISPSMPWAGARRYDMTYEAALVEVNKTVQRLRANGFKLVIAGGQSFGANGALAYAAKFGDVDGLLLFAPGHNPDIDRNFQPRIVSFAKDAIRAGNPDATVRFTDHNDGGRSQTIETRADVFVSFFAEDSLANMARSAAMLKKPIPTIVFMSSDDFITRKGRGYFFDKIPRHPKSEYNVISAGHRDVPASAFGRALEWLKDLIR